MLTEPQRLLVEALRSNAYEQGGFALCEGNRYCIFGVACDVYQKEVGDLLVKHNRTIGRRSFEGNYVSPPKKVLDWYGFKTDTGRIGSRGDSLMALNDLTSCSFEELADIIEKHADDIFKNYKEMTNHEPPTENKI